MSNIFEVKVDVNLTMDGWETAPVETDIEEGIRLSWTRTVGDYEILIWATGILDEYDLGLTIEHLPSGEILELEKWDDREQIDKILGGKLWLIKSMFEDAAMEWLENGGDYDEEGELYP